LLLELESLNQNQTEKENFNLEKLSHKHVSDWLKTFPKLEQNKFDLI